MFPCSYTQLEQMLVEPIFFVVVLFEHQSPSVNRTVHKTQAITGILAYQVEIRSHSKSIRTFMFGYSNFDVVKKSITSLPYNMKPSRLLYNFF